MAIIEVESPSGQIVEFEVAKGDRPTQEEFSAIRDILSKQGGAPQEAKPEFDTKSGVKTQSCASLSMAENNEEEENILAKAGFAAEDYIR